MALRANFVETVTAPMGVSGDLVPVPGIAATIYEINADGTEGVQATAYAGRTGTTQAASLDTDASGKVDFWLDPGEYNIHFDDPQTPPRIASFIRGFSSNPYEIGAASGGTVIPLGAVVDYGGTGDPTDADGVVRWMVADGRQLSRTTYAGLYSVIGIAYGNGDGSSTFNIPNYQGRVSIGAGTGAGLTARVLGAVGGEETHLLTHAESPSGLFTLNDPAHTHTITAAYTGITPVDPGHLHNTYNKVPSWSGTATLKSGYEGTSTASAGVDAIALSGAYTLFTDTNVQGAYTGITLSDPQHSHTVNAGYTNVTLTDNGGDSAHNNMQPFLVANRLIKVL